jgi:DNA-binding transcriptional LysR family regulator
MLKMSEEAKESVRETKMEVSGLVRVASVHSVGLYELPPYIKSFLQKFPHVNLRIEYRNGDDIYRELLAGDIDVGIVAYPNEGMSRIECRPFITDELAIMCMEDHPFAKKKNVAISELEGQNFVQFTEETPTRRATDAVLAESGIKDNVRTECDNIEILKQMIEIGYGVALLPRNSLTANDRERGLRLVDIKDVKIERPLGILLLKNAPRFKAMRAFVDTLLHHQPA